MSNNSLSLINRPALLQEAEMLSRSNIIPQAYQKNPGNVYLVCELAKHLDIPSITMLNNVYIIYGSPTLKSSFLIALANSSGLLKERISFAYHGEGLNESDTCRKCTARAVLQNNQIIEHTFAASTAIKEKWATKAGNKYETMLDLMLSYKAAAFLTRLYLPDVTCGLYTKEEMEDVQQAKQYEKEHAQSNKNNHKDDIIQTQHIPNLIEEPKKEEEPKNPSIATHLEITEQNKISLFKTAKGLALEYGVDLIKDLDVIRAIVKNVFDKRPLLSDLDKCLRETFKEHLNNIQENESDKNELL